MGDAKKFGVEHLVAMKRPDPGKPMPVYESWRGRRIIYCTEPIDSEKIHSGILKDMTGGEAVCYRLLFSNYDKSYRPQFKLHMMCNDTPNIDGRDAGMQRRVRKIDYISRFVPSEQAQPEQNIFPLDPNLGVVFDNPRMRMAFLQYLFGFYDHQWEFKMPQVVQEASSVYLEENDVVKQFFDSCVKTAPGQFFTLSEAKQLLWEKYSIKMKTLKTDLERLLGRSCISQFWGDGKNNRNAFVGFALDYGRGENV